MNTLEDLHRIFDEDASAAPHPFGVVAAAEQGATRIRRRRRVAAAAGAAVLVAVVAVAVPVVTQRHRADGPLPATTPVERAPGEITLGVDPASGYAVTNQDNDENVERISFRKPTDRPDTSHYLASAIAYDPGAGFDPTRLRRGERTAVSGHEAWYVSDYPFGGYFMNKRSSLVMRVLGWRDPTGTWVLVYQQADKEPGRARLLQAAQAVRIGAMHEMTVPVSLGPLPAGLPMNTISSDRTRIEVTLGGEPAPLDAAYATGVPPGTGVVIDARPDTPIPTGATRVAAVAGHDAWFTKSTIGTALGGGMLWVQVRACIVAFSLWDPTKATVQQLREIAAAATYADCKDPATWGPAVRR